MASFGGNISDHLQSRVLGCKQKGEAWGINTVQLHPDNCAHTNRPGVEMQVFENVKQICGSKVVDLHLIPLGRSCTASRDHLISAVFLSQGNLAFSRFCAWVNVPSGNAGTWSYFKVQLKPRGECEPLSSSHSFSESPSFVYSLLKQNLSAPLFRLQRNWFSFPFHHLYFFNYHLISSLKAGISCVFIWV